MRARDGRSQPHQVGAGTSDILVCKSHPSQRIHINYEASRSVPAAVCCAAGSEAEGGGNLESFVRAKWLYLDNVSKLQSYK